MESKKNWKIEITENFRKCSKYFQLMADCKNKKDSGEKSLKSLL